MSKETTISILKEIRDLLKDKPTNKSSLTKAPKKSGERFIDNGDGTILDMETSLMWPKEGSDKEMNFKDADKYCKDFNLAGHKDWRLPTIKELISIIDYEKYNPAIDPVFKCKSSWYWSGSVCTFGTDGAWIVGFNHGGVSWGCRSYSYFVRPVRQYFN